MVPSSSGWRFWRIMVLHLQDQGVCFEGLWCLHHQGKAVRFEGSWCFVIGVKESVSKDCGAFSFGVKQSRQTWTAWPWSWWHHDCLKCWELFTQSTQFHISESLTVWVQDVLQENQSVWTTLPGSYLHCCSLIVYKCVRYTCLCNRMMLRAAALYLHKWTDLIHASFWLVVHLDENIIYACVCICIVLFQIIFIRSPIVPLQIRTLKDWSRHLNANL